jgi:hypothetical protein
LRSLHLIPIEPARTAPPGVDPEQRPLDSHRLREILEELFYEQGSALRDDMRKEFQRLWTEAGAPPEADKAAAARPAPLVPQHYYKAASGVLLAAASVFAYLYVAASASLDRAHELNGRLVEDTTVLTAANARAFDALRTPVVAAAAADADRGVVEVLEWAMNQGRQFAFGEVPLDDERAYALTMLLEHLERIGFAGTVAVDVHVGRFCMNYGVAGDLVLAQPDQPIATCDQIGWPEAESIALGELRSSAFANAVGTASARGGLRVETISHGSQEPLVEYPPAGYTATAGAWNVIAAANQRVELRIVPEPRFATASLLR